MNEESRIRELIRIAVPTLRQRWPKELAPYSDRIIAILFNDFYFSEDAGNNDAKFPTWFGMLPDYKKEFEISINEN